MASIQMNMGTETEINATPNKDGLILFDTTNKKIILDNNGTREVLTKHIEANPNLNGAEQLENLKVNGEVLNFLPVDISNVEKDGEEISDILEDKYDTEGDYNTTVDKCTDLTRATPVTDTAPYIYRQTPVKESFKALMKKIVGVSVVWNQMVNSYISTQELNGLTITNNGDSISIEGTVETAFQYDYFVITPQTIQFKRGTNKYLIKPSFKISHKLGVGGFATCVDANSVGGVTRLSGTGIWANGIYIEAKLGDTFNIQNLRLSVIDLTAMFGTTIADYVYTLETSQSGSGIAWLQSYGFFTEDYYAYKQNKLESGCVSAKKIVGKNLFNETLAERTLSEGRFCVLENGILHYKNDGSAFFYTTNVVMTLPTGTYTLSLKNYRLVSGATPLYMIKINDGSVTYPSATQPYTFTLSGKATIDIRITTNGTTSATEFFANILLEKGSLSTDFVPYANPTTYPISPITLRGLFKLSTDKLTVDGDEYNADGSVTRKRKRLTPTELISNYQGYNSTKNNYQMYLYTSDNAIITEPSIKNPSNAISNFDTCESSWVEIQTFDHSNKIGVYHNSSWNYTRIVISIADTSVTTKEQAETWIRNNIEAIEYELATPTIEQTTPFTETEIVGSTEEFIDYEVAQGNRDVAIPVGTETDYYQSYNIPPIPFTDCYLSASNQKLGWISNS